jgi:hypothetical protein
MVMKTEKIDNKELNKITLNRMLYASNKKDYFEIDEVLEILDVQTLPIEIPINNNQVFIRDLSNYMVDNDLKPNIYKE